MTMHVKVRDLHPNPFRHMDRYPIRREKVDALRESLRKTGFWDNVVARQQDGQVQIAYGHHRLVALQEEYGPDRDVNVILRDLDDAQMLQIMANENMEEWGSSVWVEMETVAAVIQAYDEGKIELDKPSAHTVQGLFQTPLKQTYSAATVADFLGWHDPSGRPSYKVATAIEALDLIARGVLADADFAGLGTTQARAVVEQARRAWRDSVAGQAERAAKEAAKVEADAAKQRERFEAEQQRQEQAAARAKDEAARAEANRKRIAAEREAEQARQREEEARHRATAQRERAAEQSPRGREEAARVGRHVGELLRSGKRGHQEAEKTADEVMPERDTVFRRMDDHALAVARTANKLLAGDEFGKKVEELVRFIDQLTPQRRVDLVVNLREAAGRLEAAARRFEGGDVNGSHRGAAPALAALIG